VPEAEVGQAAPESALSLEMCGTTEMPAKPAPSWQCRPILRIVSEPSLSELNR